MSIEMELTREQENDYNNECGFFPFNLGDEIPYDFSKYVIENGGIIEAETGKLIKLPNLPTYETIQVIDLDKASDSILFEQMEKIKEQLNKRGYKI